MRGILLLSWRHALHNRAQTTILTLCIAVPVFLPLAARLLIHRYQDDLTARAENTPLVVGTQGNRFDLTLSVLYFRESELGTLPFTRLAELNAAGMGTAIPLNLRFTARGLPVVATSPEYFELRGLRAERGSIPLMLGDAALGARVARELGLSPGDALFSDQRELYDISKPPALKMHVCGVLAESGTPDDGAVFVDVGTAWVLEGLAHGHDDALVEVDESLVLGRTEGNVVLSQAMIEYNEVTPENLASFHYHGDPARLPLSAIVFDPTDAKAATLTKARVNASEGWQMVTPVDVIEDLMAFVFRIRALFDSLSAVLGACTVLMCALVVLLSMRIRAAEMSTLNRIGCSRFAVARLYAVEIALVVGLSLVLAAAGIGSVAVLLPDLARVLG